MAIPELSEHKSQLRSKMRHIMRGTPADSRAVGAALDRWLVGHTELRTIAVFAALPGEVDLTELIARHPECRWAYPRVVGATLVFHGVRDPAADLTSGAFGIREPAPTMAVIPLAEIDAFLCPGLAFDAQGGRLGRGRGFYDRVLAGARPAALKVGVCFARQIVATTFPEAHDVPMDVVIAA